MELLLILIFILGYIAIAIEHVIKINKTAPALLIGALMWAIWALFDHHHIIEISEELNLELANISQILFFLMGAMTIVEMIDAHRGFKIITDKIATKNSQKLLWIVSILTFFLSAVLDNLTASIVMVSLLRKLVVDKNQRLYFSGMIIIAANAGGAWSPIGDVTTTMLWIGGQISSVNIMKTLFIPSIISMFIPLFYLGRKIKNEKIQMNDKILNQDKKIKGSLTILILGISALLFVPIFKTITHLPPYIGMLFGLSILWIVSELLHKDKPIEEKSQFSPLFALTKIDVPSILFFLGILLAIGTLQGTGVLGDLATWMDNSIGNQNIIVLSIGLLSAIVDNVPLVAATMKMYPLSQFPMDSNLWEFIAYAAGTGGSCLIIGSAAGVAVMGMEKIDFIWYFKKISWLALLGYFVGAIAYILLYPIFAVY